MTSVGNHPRAEGGRLRRPSPPLDVLIPTRERPSALAVTLAGVASQTLQGFRVVVSDQTEDTDVYRAGEVEAIVRVLHARGDRVETLHNLPRLGMAHQRHFLLERSTAPFALFLDDDVFLEADMIERMLDEIHRRRCGLVGCGLIGLSHVDDIRPHEQDIEFWEDEIMPEDIHPEAPEWERYRLHNAANLLHVQQRLGVTPERQRAYKIAWAGGCVLYDTAKLRASGGFDFWRELPREHAGEDVLAQQRVMRRFGGCAILPSGAYHLQLPTTVTERPVDAPRVLR